MAKPNFILPNKPAIKAGSILSYNYTDDLKFAAEPLDFSRNSSATRVNEQGLIEEVGYFGPQLVQNGDFSQEGSELITNGDFSNGSTDWFNPDNAATFSNNSVTITGGSGNRRINQSNVTSPTSSQWKLQYEITEKVGTSDLKVYTTNSGNATYVVVPSTIGVHTYFFNTNLTTFYFNFSNSAGSITIDNVSVKEVGQDWSLTVTSPNIVQFQTDQVYLKRTVSAANELFQSVFVIGKTYKLTIQANIISEGIAIEGNGNLSRTNLISGANVFYLTPTSALLRIICVNNTTEGYISNISVIEIIGDKPRIDYSDSSTEPSLLLEPQSTNLITYSSYFSSAIWNANTDVIVDEGYLSPEGTLNAAKVTKDGTNAKLAMFIGGTAPITKSIYARTVSGTGTAYFGEGSVSGGVLSTVTEQWQRFEITVNGNNFYAVDFRGAATLTEVIVFGAQLEQKSYATSYIPTSGSTATRLGETANNAGGAGVFNSEEGVLYAEIAALANDGTYRILALSDGTSAQRVYMQYTNASNFISAVVKNGSVTQANIGYTLSDETEFSKIGFKYKLNNFALWVNGVEIATDASGLTPIGLSELSFDNGSGGNPFYGKVKNLQVFNYALTDEELQTLTT